MKSLALIVFAASFVITVLGDIVRFDNYRIYSVNIENDEQLKVLSDLEINPDGLLFLDAPTGVGQIADIVVPPHKFDDLSEVFNTHEIRNQLKTENLQK